MPAPGTRGFPRIAPDAVFDVLSPDDRPRGIRKKIADYLGRGVRLVVVVDPDDKTLVVYRPGTQPVTLRDGSQVLAIGDVIPGFSCRLSDIFE
jgi:Uma2 family endonuclease